MKIKISLHKTIPLSHNETEADRYFLSYCNVHPSETDYRKREVGTWFCTSVILILLS